MAETPKSGFRLSERARENIEVIALLRRVKRTQAVEMALDTEASLAGTPREVEAARKQYRTQEQRREAQKGKVTK